jgi:hypothetical protein
MNLKKIVLSIAMIVFMVFAISGVAEDTFAYWASNVTPPANISDTTTTSTGTWTQAFQYDPNTSYSVGDVVTNNGITYTAKKSGILREPGVASGWARDWTQN